MRDIEVFILQHYGKKIQILRSVACRLIIWSCCRMYTDPKLWLYKLMKQKNAYFWKIQEKEKVTWISALEIQVLRTSAIKCQWNFTIFWFASTTRRQKTAEDTAGTFVYYFGVPWHFSKDYEIGFLTVETTCST